LARLHSTT